MEGGGACARRRLGGGGQGGCLWGRRGGGGAKLFHFGTEIPSKDSREPPETLRVENTESDHFLETLEIVKILEILPVKRPLS